MPLIKKAVKIAKTRLKKPKREPRARKKAAAPVSAPEISQEGVEESKYFAGPALHHKGTGPVIQKFAAEKLFEFPAGYGDNRIVLMVRDPYWLYTYWEVNDQRRQE
ncbi:MAG TPA: DUF4912 domain-containing protein, partial [Candidatus Sulfotelmatobacter sp.]|nr:DUF4912 domain-containing protein [Candidatus Sulfotelmatobacter sp.]